MGYEFGNVGQAELWLRGYSGGLLELLEDVAPGHIIINRRRRRRRERRSNLY